MGTLFKALIVALIILGLTAAAGLAIMAGVAGTHDVKHIAVPKDSSLYELSTMWSHADAWRRPMEYSSFHDIKTLADNVGFKGDGELHRDDKEVVFGGHVPGIDYQFAYSLDRTAYPPTTTVVTVYRLKNTQGRYLWKVLRPIQRCLAPYMLDRLAERAPS
ncbi:MAG TPA: hypothetical protein VJS69_10945 [Candidatus Krumholzibacteria bacterium]|nr:hypothetical protein [Candidatus Krumholzibacteria bacterium]